MHCPLTQEDVDRIVRAIRSGRPTVTESRTGAHASWRIKMDDLSEGMATCLSTCLVGHFTASKDAFDVIYANVDKKPVVFSSTEQAQFQAETLGVGLDVKFLFGLYRISGQRYTMTEKDQPVRFAP